MITSVLWSCTCSRRSYQTLDSIQINSAKNMHHGCVPKHHPNGSSNMKTFTVWYLNVQLITHILCEFLIQIQTNNIGGLRWLTLFYHPCIHGATYSFNERDRVMGNTPQRQHQINGINQYLLWLHLTFSCRMAPTKIITINV